MNAQHGASRPVEPGNVITSISAVNDTIDVLTLVSIRIDAIFMAACALDDMYQDAIQALTTDCEKLIDDAKAALSTLVNEAKERAVKNG